MFSGTGSRSITTSKGITSGFRAGLYLAIILLSLQSVASANERFVQFDISETSLDSALSSFADQAGVQLMFASKPGLVSWKVSLKGSYKTSEALAILLANTGLEFEVSEDGRSFGVREAQQTDLPASEAGEAVLTIYGGAADEAASSVTTGPAGSVVDARGDTDDRVANRSPLIEEVIVTAQKREQSSQEVGIALTAFTEARIRELQFTDPIDVAGQTPGLNIRYSDGNTNPIINIRGVGLNDNNSNNNPSAAVHMDDVYLGSSAYFSFPMYDLERVEVLKGPQGTLFGRNTTGGSVNFYSRKPTTEKEGYLNVLLGNFEATNVEGAVGGALTDQLSVRVAFINVQSEGHQTNIGTIAAGTAGTNTFGPPFPDNPSTQQSKHGAEDVRAVRLAFDWNPTDRFNLLLSTHAMWDDSDNWIQRLSGPDNYGFVQPGDESTVSSEFSPGREAEGQGFVLKTTTDFDSQQLITITGYESYDRVSQIDVSGPSRFFYRDQNEDLWQFTQEIRLQSDTAGPLFWTIGGFYSDDAIDSSNGLVFGEQVTGFGATTLLTEYEQDGQSFALFGHTEYEFADDLKVTAGLRYTDEEKTYVGGSRDSDPYGLSAGRVRALPPGGAGLQVDNDYSASDVSGKIGLDWTPIEDALLYASFSKGFKSGGFDGSTLTTSVSEADPFEEETVLAYEAGFKSLLLDRRLQVNGSAFYYDYDDLQVSLRAAVTADVQATTRVNAGDAKIWGFELDLQAHPVEGFMIQAGVSYLDTEVTELGAKVTSAAGVKEGNVVPDAPEWSWNSAARYEAFLTDDTLFSIAMDISYKDTFFVNINNDPKYSPDAYTLVNARIALQFRETWEFSIWARNLFDESYVLTKDMVTEASLFPFETYAKPRTYGVGVRYTF